MRANTLIAANIAGAGQVVCLTGGSLRLVAPVRLGGGGKASLAEIAGFDGVVVVALPSDQTLAGSYRMRAGPLVITDVVGTG